MRTAMGWTIAMGLVCALSGVTHAQDRLPALRVSDNARFLVTSEGAPFFWLGDTAWELFHRQTREDADRYLEVRARQGFTVIQVVALAEFEGLSAPNAYGHLPLLDNDPARPDVRDGPDNDYWDHVDYIVDKANAVGIYIGLLPTWGDKWNRGPRGGPEIFTPENARVYGEWLGRRYRDRGVIWIVGGDRPVETDAHRQILDAMARGLRRGDEGRHLITFHPRGGDGSAQYFHDADWLDFNMRQTGHHVNFDESYHLIREDYARTPVKPVLDGEPVYDGHPISFRAAQLGHSIAADVRRPLYWGLFSGAFGHTYGHHSVWQMWTPDRAPVNNPLVTWQEAIEQPGGVQMQYGRWLMESRPFLSRIPDDSVIVTDRVRTSVPGAGRYRFVATRDEAGTYAMVYAPVGRAFRVRMNAITGQTVTAWWFNPRTGEAHRIGTFSNQGEREFLPPDPGETLDWILVLDDAARGYPPPGTRSAPSGSSTR